MGTVMCVDWLLTSAGVMLATYCRSRGSANCLTTPPQASRSAASGQAACKRLLSLPTCCIYRLTVSNTCPPSLPSVQLFPGLPAKLCNTFLPPKYLYDK
jgi:hypothetical protein